MFGKMFVNVMKAIANLWQNSFLFVFLVSTTAIVFIVFYIIPLCPKFNLLNPAVWIIGALLILSFIGVIAIIAIAGIGGLSLAKKEGKIGSLKITGDIIRNVPTNHAWVLRNAWSWLSSPGKIKTDEQGEVVEEKPPRGYVSKGEGWNFFLPYIWHVDLGFVDLAPVPEDPKPITINTSDNQTAEVDYRTETIISDPIRYMIRVRTNEQRQKFEKQRITVAIEQICSGFSQITLTNLENDKLKEMEKEALRLFNQGIKSLGIQATAVDIQNIIAPQEIRDAAEYKTVATERAKAAEQKGLELNTLIEKTMPEEKGFLSRFGLGRKKRPDATKIIIADRICSVLPDIFNPIFNTLKKKGEKNDQ